MALVKILSPRIFGMLYFPSRPKTLHSVFQCILLFQKSVVYTDWTDVFFQLDKLIFKLNLISLEYIHSVKRYSLQQHSYCLLDHGSVAGMFNVELSVSVVMVHEVRGSCLLTVSPTALAGLLSWLEHHSNTPRPGQGTYKEQPMNAQLSGTTD